MQSHRIIAKFIWLLTSRSGAHHSRTFRPAACKFPQLFGRR